MEHEKIQWHPAFDAALQIELAEDADSLTFEPEHLLGKKPMQVDELVIKKNVKKRIHKGLGHIFQRHNIIEYKSPDDYLSLNDFYKTYGYACFYQADTKTIGKIAPEDISITFVCNHYPREMLRHIYKFRRISIKKYAEGIYHLTGDPFPMQLVITHELSKEEYYWLQHLRDNLKAGEEIEDIAKHYAPNKNSELYQAVMNVIVRGNRKEMEVEQHMCEALYELFEDELKEREERGKAEGKAEALKALTEGKAEAIIETCAEFRVSREETREQLIKKLSLSEISAEEYMQKYWK